MCLAPQATRTEKKVSLDVLRAAAGYALASCDGTLQLWGTPPDEDKPKPVPELLQGLPARAIALLAVARQQYQRDGAGRWGSVQGLEFLRVQAALHRVLGRYCSTFEKVPPGTECSPWVFSAGLCLQACARSRSMTDGIIAAGNAPSDPHSSRCMFPCPRWCRLT